MKIKKNIVVIVSVIFGFLILSSEGHAYCEKVKKILIDTTQISQTIAYNMVKDAFDKFTDYASNERYELCFDFPEHGNPVYIPLDSMVFNFAPNEPEKDLVIQGLKLRQTSVFNQPILNISYANSKDRVKAILDGVTIENATNALAITNGRAEIIGSNITGTGTGTCVYFGPGSDGSKMVSSTIGGLDNNDIPLGGCAHGVEIEANDIFLGAQSSDKVVSDANDISGHTVDGVYVKAGNGNSFGYNLIRKNGNPPDDMSETVVITEGENDGIQSPQQIKFEEDGKTGTFKCDPDSEGNIKKRIARFDKSGGWVQIYTVGSAEQPYEFLISCELDSEGICDLTELPICGAPQPWQLGCVPLVEGECGLDKEFNLRAAAIYTNNGSSEFASMDLDGVVVFTEGGIVQTTVPEATSGGDEGAIITSGAGGEGIGIEMATAGPGGCGGSGGSLIPNDISKTVAPNLGLWWLIFSLVFLAGLRLRRVRTRRRK